MIAIIDYGLGNPLSIKNMLKKIGEPSVITSDFEVLGNADKLILPGVGNFEKGMQNIEQTGLRDFLNTQVLEKKKPILGICLGMQLMTSFSEEGHVQGLGFVNARTEKFIFDESNLKVPHMAWTDTNFENAFAQNNEFEGNLPRFYYVHSYFVKCENRNEVLCTANYGNRSFDSGFIKDNIMGVQFHPEKSHVFGKKFLEKFVKWNPK